MNEETAIEVRMDHAEIRLDKHEDVIDRIRDRLPVWATAVIGVLMAIGGWLLHMAAT